MVYDAVVIGAGVVGAFVARELQRYKIKLVILEGGADVAMGSSRANSGIVHAGFDAPTGSKKAIFNVRGNKLMGKVTAELGVKYGNLGSLVVAYSTEELPTLNELYERGIANGVPGMRIIGADELREEEPNISPQAVGALFAESAGIVCPYELTIAAVGNAMDNGAQLRTNFNVDKIERYGINYKVTSQNGDSVISKIIINCAGINADSIARELGDKSFAISGRKGEYLLLDKQHVGLVSHTIFACPTAAGKGVLISPTVDGNIILGPTSREMTDRNDINVAQEGIDEIILKAKKMCKNVPTASVITSFAGMRAYSSTKDFVVGWSYVQNLYNVAGIESPGLTSAPAIGEFVASQVASRLNLAINNKFNPHRTSDFFVKFMSKDEQNELIKERAEFGKIVCRCEQVSLGEILDSCRRNPIPTTLDGIKLRTRAGMGRCQGGFCSPTVLEILMSELGIDETQVTKNGEGSQILVGRTK